MTVGSSLMKLNAETAIIVVLAHSLVLFVFSSQSLSDLFVRIGLPAIPLVPVSSSQAIVGAIIGIGILKGGRNIQINVIGKIAVGWFLTPVIAGLLAFFALFFMSNVFNLKVSSNPSKYVKGDIVVTDDAKVSIDDKTKTIENFYPTDKEVTTFKLYKPAVIIVMIILLLVIIYQLYVINKLKEKDKLEEYQESIDRYDTQQILLAKELKTTNDANLKLEKEIDAKEKEQKKIALSIIRKNEILSKLKTEIENLKSKPEETLKFADLNTLKLLIIENLSVENERKSFNKYIRNLNDSFYKNLEIEYPGLSENEKKLCSLLRLKLTSKEIASILNITPKSVEVSRYRLRKKMNIKKNEKLSKMIRKL
jgi:phosphate/sulfate permease/DNA-binding CsgD family transcriptional regulator